MLEENRSMQTPSPRPAIPGAASLVLLLILGATIGCQPRPSGSAMATQNSRAARATESADGVEGTADGLASAGVEKMGTTEPVVSAPVVPAAPPVVSEATVTPAAGQEDSGSADSTVAPPFEPTLPGFESTATEAELAARILALARTIPKDVRRPQGMTVEQLHALVDDMLRLGEYYLAKHPEGASRADVIPPVAHLWVVNNTRFFIQFSQQVQKETGKSATKEAMAQLRQQYFDKVIQILDEGLELHPAGESNREMWRLRGQATWFSQRYSESVEAYRTLLERYPDDPASSENLLALINAYISSKRFAEAVEMADLFFDRFPMDELIPHVYQLKGKALTEGGRAVEALEWWISIGEALEQGAKGIPVRIGDRMHTWGAEARQAFQRYYDERGFMIGFLQFYLGRFEDARASFGDALTKLLQLQAEKRIEPRSQVYLTRTDKVHSATLILAGKPAPDLGIGTWLDDIPGDPRAEKGNVMVLLFTPYENDRYEDIQKIMQRLYRDRWHEGLRVAWVADPKGFQDIPSQIARLDAQRQRLELTYPVGLETEKEWPNFQRYLASVGGGTMVLLNRAGDVVWFKMDPTFRDENLIERILDRLLLEPAPAE